jgi:hypothetical protein
MTPDIVTEMANLLRRGRLADLYSRAERINSPMIAILRARALIAQGYAAGPEREGGTAEAILKKLENDPDGDVALMAQVELLHAHYVGAMMGDSRAPAIHEATALGRRAGSRPGVQTAVLFLAGYLAGQLAIRARRFDVGRDELQKVEKLARSKSDGAMLALAEMALGRLSAWQGRADLAAGQLNRAIAFWDSQENALMAAHVRYELAVLHTDRREWRQAIDELKNVIAVYEASGVHKGYLDRARQALGNALIGGKQLAEAGPLLEGLRGAKDPYRAAMVQRDLARLSLALAENAVGAEAKALIEKAHKDWQTGRDLVKDAGPDDFATLSLRLVEGQLIAAAPAMMGAESAAVGADVLARVAELFSAPAQTSKKIGEIQGLAQVERPHEINARIAAIKAYVAAGKAAPGAAKSLFAAALTETARLREAAAAIDLQLDDETFALLTQVEELAGRTPALAMAEVGASLPAGAEESLLTFMRRETPESERLNILARLATDLDRLYGMGVKPCGFGPGDVIVRSPGIPVIKTFEGPAAALRPERGAERAFMAPELFKTHAEIDFRADLYVIGVLLIVWFGEDPPANKGFWLPMARAWRRPLKKRGTPLAELALELTALKPANRPESASIAADRLRQAALALSPGRTKA